MSNSSTKRRGGFTIIELLVAVTLGGIAFSTIAFTLHFMFRLDRRIRSEIANDAMLPRLASQFRGDIHAAVSSELRSDGSSSMAVLTRPNGERIEYRLLSGRIERRVLEDERVVHRELFRCEGGAAVAWERSEADPPLIRMKIARDPRQREGGSGRYDSIEASLGLDYR